MKTVTFKKLTLKNKNNSNSKNNLLELNKGVTHIKTNSLYNNKNNNSININYNYNKSSNINIDISNLTNRLSKKQKFIKNENKINVNDIIIVYLCYCNNKFNNSKKEMMYLMKNKLKYTDITENLKLFLQFEKIKDIFYKKELLHPLDFKDTKKKLKYNLKDLQIPLKIVKKNTDIQCKNFEIEEKKFKKNEKSHVGTKINIQSILNSNIIEKKLSNKSLNYSIENEYENEREDYFLNKKEK